MDLFSPCERSVTPVRLDPGMASLVASTSRNATAVWLEGVSLATSALLLFVCVLVAVWSHCEKTSVPGQSSLTSRRLGTNPFPVLSL